MDCGTFIKVDHATLARRDMTANGKLLLAHLRFKVNGSTAVSITVRELARDLGITPKSVVRSQRELVGLGELAIESGKGSRENEYTPARKGESNALACEKVTQDGRQPEAENGEKVTRPCDLFSQNQGESNALACEKVTHIPRRKKERTKNKKAAKDAWAEALKAMTGDQLRTDAFRVAWAEWVADRKDRGKALTARGIAKQIKELEGYGHDGAIASIQQSIKNGWTGIFDPSQSNGGAKRGQQGGPARIQPPQGKYDRFNRVGAPAGPSPTNGTAATVYA